MTVFFTPLMFQTLTILRSGLGHLLLLVVSIALHLLIAHWFLKFFYAPQPASAAPQLIVESIELTLAEMDSDIIAESIPTTIDSAASLPIAETAPYLTTSDSDIIIPEASPLLTSAAPISEIPTPHFILPTLSDQTTNLPEITLPPMEIATKIPQEQTPQQSSGATARIEHPELQTDLAALRKSYPEEARRNHWEGTVTLRLKINAKGHAEVIEVLQSSGYRVLDREAQKMLRRARFRGGPGELIQQIEYTLKK